MARADKNFDAMAVERESRLARRLPLPELDCAVCARPLEVLQGQHGNLSRMLARRHDQALGPTSFPATDSLEGLAHISFEAWPVLER